MKTNIVKLFFGAAVALSTVSCEDFLTVSPVDKVGAETFFAGEKDLLLFANRMLSILRFTIIMSVSHVFGGPISISTR